jgi:hypothetical protein
VPAPNTPGTPRGGFDAYGATCWANFREGRPKEVTIAGLTIMVRTGVLTVRDNPFVQTLRNSDQVEMNTERFEINTIRVQEIPTGAMVMEIDGAPTRTAYDIQFDTRGEMVTLRRVTPSGNIDIAVRAIVTGYSPEELVGGIELGERRIFIPAKDLEGTAFPGSPKQNDRVIVRGRSLSIIDVDDSTLRYADTLNAYVIRASG